MESGEKIRITTFQDPIKYEAVIIDVEFDPVLYTIYSLLPKEDTLKIAETFSRCENDIQE